MSEKKRTNTNIKKLLELNEEQKDVATSLSETAYKAEDDYWKRQSKRSKNQQSNKRV